MKYIPLANLKNKTGIVAFCKDAKEIVVANRNVLLNVHRDMELVAEPVLIRTFNNPAEIVRICENEMGKVVPVLRNGVDEIYVMDYEAYRMRKECFIKLL